MPRWSWTTAIVVGLTSLGAACDERDPEPCKRRNHCRRLADGSVACAPGYTWRNSADPTDLVCIPAVPDCSGCTPPAAWCRDVLTLVTHTTTGCVASTCSFVPQETACALGCDEEAGACLGCANACTSPGAAQCHDGRVRACVADANGCLGWGSFIRCADGVCASVDSCAGCVHGCGATGARECVAGQVRQCVLDAEGCRRWTDFFPCASEACADAASCQAPDRPTTETSCSTDGWCWVHPQPTGNRLSGVWGLGSTAWAVGRGGTVMHWTGEAWSLFPAWLSTALHGVFGASISQVWAVGEAGAIWRFNGSSWAAVTSPTAAHLYAGWCAAVDDCWAVGDAVVLRWQGDGWTRVTLPIGVLGLYDVWGGGPDDVWIAGYGQGGAMLHWDGQVWRNRPTGSSAWLRFARLWGNGAGDVWAAADTGSDGLWRWRGGGWEAVPVGVAGTVRAVWGRGQELWVAVDGVIRRWDGALWSTVGSFPGTEILDFWGDDAGGVWAVGDGGSVLYWNGAWQVRAGLPGAARQTYAAVWGVADEVRAAGSELGRWDGSAWSSAARPALGGDDYLVTGIWGLAGVWWMVADNGVVLRDDGGTWQQQTQLSGGLRGLWGAANDDLWVVADNGVASHWNGAGWQSQTLGGGAVGLWGIHGSSANHVVAVGGDASVFLYDGMNWTPVHHEFQGDWLTAVWTSGTETWVGGSDAVFYRWVDQTWSEVPSGTGQWIQTLWGQSNRDLWAVAASAGGYGEILHYNGEHWRKVTSHAGAGLTGLWGSSAGEMWAVGAGAAVLRHETRP